MSYFTQVDQSVRLSSVLLLPIMDNSRNLIAAKLDPVLFKKLESEYSFQVSALTADDRVESNLDLEHLLTSPDAVVNLQRRYEVDTVVATRMIFDQEKVSLRMVVFHGAEGLPLVESVLGPMSSTSLDELSRNIGHLTDETFKKLNYRGTIISRTGQQVTISVGSFHGFKEDDLISVIQYLSARRNPNTKIVEQFEYEVIGKIRVVKTDQYLSFGYIVEEREPSLLSIGHKLALYEREKVKVPFQPQFGLVHLLFGFEQYTQTLALENAGTITMSKNYVPTVLLGGEAWVTKDFFIGLEFKQSQLTDENPVYGSRPERIDTSYGHFHVMGIYNVARNFANQSLKVMAGYHHFEAQSTVTRPAVFTNVSFAGPSFGVSVGFSISDRMKLDAEMKKFWGAEARERAAVTSGGTSQPGITLASLKGTYAYSDAWNILLRSDFGYYSVDFSGTGNRTDPATSNSHKFMGLLAGMEYLF